MCECVCVHLYTHETRARAHARTHTLHPKPYAAQLEVQAIEDLQEEDEALGEYDDDAEDEARPSEGECGEREGEEGEGDEGEGEEWGGEEGEGENGLQRQRMADTADMAAKIGADENSNERGLGSDSYLVPEIWKSQWRILILHTR